MNPRRQGTIKEYQNGHWFLYVTEWEETTGGSKRKHTEVEIYYAKAEHIWDSLDKDNMMGDPLWNTTDPNKLEEAMKIFIEKPEKFRETDSSGKLPEPKSIKTFPVHSWSIYRKDGYKDCPPVVPWAILEPFETQAIDNHSQTLERLAERGGLCPTEMYAIMNGLTHREMEKEVDLKGAIKFINKKVAEHDRKQI